jgi:hypothetical protein
MVAGYTLYRVPSGCVEMAPGPHRASSIRPGTLDYDYTGPIPFVSVLGLVHLCGIFWSGHN